MNVKPTVSLDKDDPKVRAAREAEHTAYDHYGLTPTEHYFEIDDLEARIRVVEAGDGPPLVLISGSEGKGMQWLPLLPELDEFTLYVMDRPGGGLSDGIDYRSAPLHQLATSSTLGLFDYFSIESAPVIGNSIGGAWALRFALSHPDRVSGIGLLGCPALYPGWSPPLPMRIGSISFLSGFLVENMMQADQVDDVKDGWEILNHPKETRDRLPREFVEAWYRMDVLPTYKPTWVGILQSMLRLRGSNPEAALTPEDFASIEAPVTLLWGSEDPFGSVETGRDGARHFDEAEFHEVGTGHHPWFDEPERCGELLRAFLGDLYRRARTRPSR